MPAYQFSLLIQAAATALLFLLFVFLFQRFRRKAFSEWIASWACLLIGLSLLFALPSLKPKPYWVPVIHGLLLAHIVFLLRGVRRFRNERAATGGLEVLWFVAVVAVAWMSSLATDPTSGRAVPIVFLLGAGYLTASIFFAVSPGPPAGRVLLSLSFLLWAAERGFVGASYLRYLSPAQLPELVQYTNLAAMFLEMMIAVGIIIFLFESGQARLATEMRQLQHSDQQLKEMGIRDSLTGLYNRHHFNDVIRRELANVRRYGSPLSVLIVDVDRFKQINDVKGHAVGDEVLKFVANYLTTCLRESDYVFRWGGDEFLILLPRTDQAAVVQKSEDLARNLPSIPGTEQVEPGLSVGWATHESESEFPLTLSQADARMYEMKLKGKKAREERERDLGRLGGGDRPPLRAGP